MCNSVQKAAYFLNFHSEICNEGCSRVIETGYAEG
jgi:hypothetical protein